MIHWQFTAFLFFAIEVAEVHRSLSMHPMLNYNSLNENEQGYCRAGALTKPEEYILAYL